MAELATIARPYAEALFRVAVSGSESSNLAAWSDLVSEIGQIALHPDIQALTHNPKISAQQVSDIFLAALKSPAGDEAKNFLSMLAENGRLTLLPEIAVQFHVLKNAQEGAADADITSAFDMSETQLADLVSILEKKFGRKLNPSVSIDPSLIGGVRVVVGDEVLDTSVRIKLQQMQVALTA
jgi:F-type H+-transporting ATPase subunit delta